MEPPVAQRSGASSFLLNMLNSSPRFLTLLLATLGLASVAFAQKASLVLNCFPSISVADGRSTVTVTAEVRDLSGSFVRDGTPVVFETDRGTFRSKNVIETSNGSFISMSTTGTVRIKAKGALEIEGASIRINGRIVAPSMNSL